jgi:hypothetical protein
LARFVMKDLITMTNRLATIATRQRTSRVRDLFFAAAIALASIVGATSVATAANAATHSLSR